MIHTTSHVAAAIALYSAFVKDLEMVDCFLDFQETKDSPIKMQYPIIDLLVSGHEAQSESVMPFTCNSDAIEKNTPFLGSFFKYCKTLYAASRCGFLCFDIN